MVRQVDDDANSYDSFDSHVLICDIPPVHRRGESVTLFLQPEPSIAPSELRPAQNLPLDLLRIGQIIP